MALVKPNSAVEPGAEDHAQESGIAVFWRRFQRNKTAVLGLAILVVLFAMALLAPWIAPEPWDHLNILQRNQPPSAGHLMGTDQYGRDILSRIIWGSRVSLEIGFLAMSVAVVVGSIWGAIAGYYGGTWLDITLMRMAEAIETIPLFFLLVVMASVFEGGITTTMLIIGLTSWPGLAFLVRGQFLSLRERDYVQASRALGAGDARIIFRHILPNVFAIIIISATLRIGAAILAEAGLSYLGFGAKPPTPTWGEAISSGRNFLRQAPWVATFPGIFITLTVLSFNLVGDGLRDALDPKMKR